MTTSKGDKLTGLAERWRIDADTMGPCDCADELEAALSQGGEGAAPWLYAISETNQEGVESWHDGKQCVFGNRESAQDEVDMLNDAVPEGEGSPFKLVPLYRAATPAPVPGSGNRTFVNGVEVESPELGPASVTFAPATRPQLSEEQVRNFEAWYIKFTTETIQDWTGWDNLSIGEQEYLASAFKCCWEAALLTPKGTPPRPAGCICSEAYGVGPEQCGKHGTPAAPSTEAGALGHCDSEWDHEPHTKCPECLNWRPLALPASQPSKGADK